MNSYTSNIEANLIIEQQVKKISEYIRVELGDHLIALLLAGSFGRGEGSIEVCGENSYKPINDYDFVLIVSDKFKLNKDYVSKWRATCSSLANDIAIDFTFIKYSKIPSHSISQANYDIKYGSIVVSGNSGVLDRFPEYPKGDLPLAQAQILLTTRFWCFIGIMEYLSFNGQFIKTKSKTNFILQQISKALIAVGDSYLIINERYEVQYKKKLIEFCKIRNIDDKSKKFIKWGYNYKLNNTIATSNNFTLHNLYFSSLELFLATYSLVVKNNKLHSRRGYAMFYAGIRHLIRRGRLTIFKEMLLNYIQHNFLKYLALNHYVRRVSLVNSFLLLLYAGLWEREVFTYAKLVAKYRLK